MTNAFVTGASGYLAHRLVPILAEHAAITAVCRQPPTHYVPRVAFQSLDITNPAATIKTIHQAHPDVIIHAAAANPGHDEATMWAVNFEATKSLAEVAGELGLRMVFISTDIVHNGSNAPYADDAKTDPVNAYGRSKAAGEEAVLANCKSAIVARTSLIYGLEQIDRGTAGFIKTLESGAELTLFQDVLRQPIWIDSLCRAIGLLAFQRTIETGTINLAGDQVMSRADFALKMLRHWGVKSSNINLASARSIKGLPMDCTMLLDRAAGLGIDLPGVDAVLNTAPKRTPINPIQ